MTTHIPVMVDEVIRNLDFTVKGVYVDATLGGGGYFKRLLEKVSDSVVIGIDQDIEAIELVRKDLGLDFKDSEITVNGFSCKVCSSTDSGRNTTVFLVNSNFNNLISILESLAKDNTLVAVIADLGFSTDQLERKRGFSFMKDDEELDMRMSLNLGVKAKDFLNALGVSELTKIFSEYADEKFANKLARFVNDQRKVKPFESVRDLNNVLYKLKYSKDKYIDLKQRIYQSLRIAVNYEFDALRGLLTESLKVMNEKTRVMVVSFHSGEDRIVKDFIRSNNLKNIFSDFLTPSEDEIARNQRSRSAKLRGFTK